MPFLVNVADLETAKQVALWGTFGKGGVEHWKRKSVGSSPRWSTVRLKGRSSSSMSNLAQKLNPHRFPGMSPKMAAIVGCILGETFTDPAIASLVVTSDQCVLAMHEGDIGYNDFIGSEEDLKRNWLNLLMVADLTQEELNEAHDLYAAKVKTPEQA